MCDLTAPQFIDEDKAREHLEALRWPDGSVCPHCGNQGGWKIEGAKSRPGLYKCKAYACRKQFSCTVGTVFERSKIPLTKWLMAVYLMCSSKKGISSHQISRMLGVTYKSAWFMTHRIREAMREENDGLLGSGSGTVEVDETFGNKRKPRRQDKKGRGYQHIKVGREFASHGVVQHGIGEYVRGDIHNNTVEEYFSIFKRGLMGTFHHVSPGHLKRYVCEFDYRYNYRTAAGYIDRERAEVALRGIGGNRLMYRESCSDT